MFNLKKPYRDIGTYPDTWSMLHGKDNGGEFVVRLRSGLKEAAGHAEYPFQIGVAVPCSPDDKAVAQRLIELEDSLGQLLRKEGAILAAIITNPAMREFVFYAKQWTPDVYDQQVKELGSAQFPDLTLQFMMRHDPHWNTFRTLSGVH